MEAANYKSRVSVIPQEGLVPPPNKDLKGHIVAAHVACIVHDGGNPEGSV